MNLISKFGLGALLVISLNFPALAQNKHRDTATSKRPSESSKEIKPAPPAPVPVPYPNVDRRKTPTEGQALQSGVKGKETPATPDQDLWVPIRNRTNK
jgi:hypothetical protein